MDVVATPLCLTKDAPNLENGIRNVKPLSIFMTYTFLSFGKCCQNKNLVSNYSAASASTTTWMALLHAPLLKILAHRNFEETRVVW